MSDQGFDFSPPPPRRERKEFEPPPWERDLFDRSVKERDPSVVVPAVMPSEPAPDREVEPASEPPATTEQGTEHEEKSEGSSAAAQLADSQVAAMLFELKAEEGPASEVYVKATLLSGALLLFIGIVMVIWSFVMIAVALRQPGRGFTGVFIGLTVLLFGAGFAGTGAWFVFKTLRQQGVL